MSQLHREEILDRIGAVGDERRIVVMPLLDEGQVGPASIDLRLGTEFRLLRRTTNPGLDPREQDLDEVSALLEEVTVPIGDCLWLHPDQFLLGSTLEFIQLPADLGAYVLGRSSWGRVGLLIATAIMVHPGFSGNLTLELVNHGESPIAIYPGCRIGQIALHELPAMTEQPYRGKYVDPVGPEGSLIAKERSEIESLVAVAGRLESS